MVSVYSVWIDTFYGLAAVRAGLMLDPEFNLTLHVASASLRHMTYVE